MELKEELTIRQEGGDEYRIVRTIEEQISAETLLKVYADIREALKSAKDNIELLPKQMVERENYLRKEVAMLEKRMVPFQEYAEQFETELAVEKNVNGGP